MLKQYCVKLRRANWLLVITLSQCSTDCPTAIAWPPSPFQASGMFFPFSHLWGTWHFQYRLKSEATLLTRFSGTPSVHNTLINTAWRPTSLTTTMINDRKESHSIVSDRMLIGKRQLFSSLVVIAGLIYACLLYSVIDRGKLSPTRMYGELRVPLLLAMGLNKTKPP